jgi:hypothetical protein
MIMVRTSRYTQWLRGLVDRPGSFYDILFDAAWQVEYEYSVLYDANRAEDGLRLRERFEYETSTMLPDHLGECRMLEFLVALAIRINEATYDWDKPDQTSEWFWKMIFNLGLQRFDDTYSDDPYDNIINVFECVNLRLYNENGTDGGLFPLRRSREDQRHVEIWYQMMAYLSENL